MGCLMWRGRKCRKSYELPNEKYYGKTYVQLTKRLFQSYAYLIQRLIAGLVGDILQVLYAYVVTVVVILKKPAETLAGFHIMWPLRLRLSK
jgi:hypothetical protein